MQISSWIVSTILLSSLAGCVTPLSVSATDQSADSLAADNLAADKLTADKFTTDKFASVDSAESSFQSYAAVKKNLNGLQQYARDITVKVISGDNWGSGILIRRQGQSYTVLTNQHVIWIGDRLKVQTPDGKTYLALRDPSASFGKNDLGILKFTTPSPTAYPIATLGCALQLPKGTPVFAAGFPLPLTERSTKGFKFTAGAISLINQKAFEGGYQIGYSNHIEKGMSGGPVLNMRAEVIAVNGMHQEPLWGDPYIYQDGSKPNIGFNILSSSSWAIPIETAVHTVALRNAQSRNQCLTAKR